MKKSIDEKVKKAILNIDKKVTEIYNSLSDMNLKLHHIIQDNRSAEDVYYGMRTGKNYLE